MSFINVKDRIPTKVLPNGAIRYGVYDENNNFVRYEYMKREDEPVEEGTAINRNLFREIYKMNNYELMTVEQEDISEVTVANTTTSVITNATAGNQTWDGNLSGKQDTRTHPFTISAQDGYSLKFGTSGSNNYINIGVWVNGTSSATLNSLNTILSRTSYNSENFLAFYKYNSQTPEFYLTWDFLEPCMPTLNYRIEQLNMNAYAMQGSNDGAVWDTLGNLANKSNYTYTPTTAYRYYRIRFFFHTSSDSYLKLHYMYWSNVPDKKLKYKNNFTVDNDFTLQELKNVIVPTFENGDCVIENTINGMNYDEILEAGEELTLRYYGEKIIKQGVPCTTGNFSATKNNLQTIHVGFTPDLVICYNADNNLTAVSGATSPSNHSHTPRILTKAYSATANGQIIDDGFTYKIGTEANIYYIAIKF